MFFFTGFKVPEGYQLQNYCNLVHELLINDDPEYQWIDKIRTPRTSNETRQKLFLKLSGELQVKNYSFRNILCKIYLKNDFFCSKRRIGIIARDVGANCVLGYDQMFDLEGEHGIVVRG